MPYQSQCNCITIDTISARKATGDHLIKTHFPRGTSRRLVSDKNNNKIMIMIILLCLQSLHASIRLLYIDKSKLQEIANQSELIHGKMTARAKAIRNL